MRTFWILFWAQMRNRLGLSVLQSTFRTDKKRFLRDALIALCAVVGVGSVVFAYAFMVSSVFQIAQGPFAFVREMLMALLFLFMPIMMLITGTATMLGTLYFGRDAELLAALPARQRTVFASKFAQVLFFEYLFVLGLCLPPVILYAPGFSLSYAARALGVMILLPFIPLTLSAALSLLLMRMGALVRHRDMLTVAAAFVGIGAIFAFQAYIMKTGEENLSAQAILTFLMSRKSLVDLLVGMYPPSGWALRALSEAGASAFGQLGLLALASGLCLAATLWLSGRLYERGLSAAGETASGGRRRGKAAPARPRSQAQAVFLREWRIVLRTPVYAMNALIGIPMAPILLCMLTFAMPAGLQGMAAMLGGAIDPGLVTLGLTALLALIASLNTAGVTAYSREGSLLGLNLSLPVCGRTLTLGKHLFGVSIAAATILAGLLAAVFALGVTLAQAAYASAAALVFAATVNAAGLLFDLYHPRLSWTSPTEAIKQGINPMMCMIAAFAQAVVVGGGAFLLLRAGVGTQIVLPAVAALTALLCALAHAALLGLCEKLYAALTVEA